MTEKEQFVQMLFGANVVFIERPTPGHGHVIELDNGGGALALFDFNPQGILETFAIDKDAY